MITQPAMFSSLILWYPKLLLSLHVLAEFLMASWTSWYSVSGLVSRLFHFEIDWIGIIWRPTNLESFSLIAQVPRWHQCQYSTIFPLVARPDLIELRGNNNKQRQKYYAEKQGKQTCLRRLQWSWTGRGISRHLLTSPNRVDYGQSWMGQSHAILTTPPLRPIHM